MKFMMLYQDPETDGRGCPSVYLAETGSLVVQGPGAGTTKLPGVAGLSPGEAAVRVATEVLERGVTNYRMSLPSTYERPDSSCDVGEVLYLEDSDEFVARGPELDAADLRELVSVLPTETAVRLTPSIATRAVDRYQAHRR